MATKKEFEDIIKKLEVQAGGSEYVFKASEAPKVQVISTGIPSLDVAIGIGGWPRGCVVEIFGKASTGKTALSIHTCAEVHKRGGHTVLLNTESLITQESWINWANSIAPPGWDPELHVFVTPKPDQSAVQMFGYLCESGVFDVMIFDSLGNLSTKNELEHDKAKQAYGQSGMITQLMKQSMHYCNGRNKTGIWSIPILLNQVRDGDSNRLTGYVQEKAPGGRAKEHGSTLRLNLTSKKLDAKLVKIDGEDISAGFTVGATLIKNKVGTPRRKTNWEFWDYPSPDGVLGIDVFSNGVNTFLQQGILKQTASWYHHNGFPTGKLNGGPAVIEYLRSDPQLFEELRRETVLKVYNESEDAKELEKEVREVTV